MNTRSSIIGDHGTMVVLLGRDLHHDTTLAPDSPEVTHKDYWFQHVANRQFYKIPHGIALTSKLALVEGKPHLRTITGYSSVLDRFKLKSGSVQLSDATARWWILDESRSVELYRRRPYYQAFSGTKKQGHMAAIYRGELFDFTSHDAAIPLLQKFGILAGYNHVAIYVEPTAALAVTANLTRTSLVLPDGTSLPWNRWAGQFVNNMPPDLADDLSRNTKPQQARPKPSMSRSKSTSTRSFSKSKPIAHQKPLPTLARSMETTEIQNPELVGAGELASRGTGQAIVGHPFTSRRALAKRWCLICFLTLRPSGIGCQRVKPHTFDQGLPTSMWTENFWK